MEINQEGLQHSLTHILLSYHHYKHDYNVINIGMPQGGPRFSPMHSPVRYRRYSPISPLRFDILVIIVNIIVIIIIINIIILVVQTNDATSCGLSGLLCPYPTHHHTPCR